MDKRDSTSNDHKVAKIYWHLVLRLLWPWLTNRLWTLMSNSHSSHSPFERCMCVRMFPTRLIRKTFMIWEKTILWRQASDTVTHALNTLWQHVFLLFTMFNFPPLSGLLPAFQPAGLALLPQRSWTSTATCMNISTLYKQLCISLIQPMWHKTISKAGWISLNPRAKFIRWRGGMLHYN